jgi:hypothetical protein
MHVSQTRAPGAQTASTPTATLTWTTRPRQDSNLRTRFRRPVLYPLSYGGGQL